MSTPSDSLALVDNSPGPSTARVVLEKSVVYLVLVFNQVKETRVAWCHTCFFFCGVNNTHENSWSLEATRS